MEIRYAKSARQALERSNKRQLLLEKIALLATDPDALENDVTQLKGRSEWRLRLQDWRVVFVRDGDTVLIRDIAPRGAVYEG